MLRKIISGGQTGADRAALDAALAHGFPAGGSCPVGRQAEDGEIAERYPLTEISGGYRQRTKRNVEDSDGTAIFYWSELRGGTALTVQFCMKQEKPFKLIDASLVSRELAAAALLEFIEQHAIGTLNVAGPRASACPEVHAFVEAVIGRVLP